MKIINHLLSIKVIDLRNKWNIKLSKNKMYGMKFQWERKKINNNNPF